MDYLEVPEELYPYFKKFFTLAYSNGIIKEDGNMFDKMAQLNAFILKRGTVKKPVLEMTKEELINSIKQQEAVRKSKQNSYATKLTKQLLEELNLTVQN